MKGRILQSTGSWYIVQLADGKQMNCRIKGKFRLDGLKSTNPIAVGDWVKIRQEENLETGIIEDILPRDNYIIRQSPRNKHRRHIIAANIDQALLIITFSKPRTSAGFIDRFLVAAESYHIPTILVFNKADIYKKKDKAKYEEAKATYEALGYTCLLVSAETGAGMDNLVTLMKDKASLIAGHSGVGKSTIINYLHPTLDLATRNISKVTGKGMHTTTFTTMYELPIGGYIIDSPGIKEYGVVHLAVEEISHYMPEMKDLLGKCQFNNCLHINEPVCAIKEALVNDEIAESRYISYLKMIEDLEAINYWEREK